MLPPRRKSKILIFVMCAATSVGFLMVLFHLLFSSKVEYLRANNFNKRRTEARYENSVSLDSKSFPGEKLVHLDLKGAPPLVGYLKEFFSHAKNLGATGLLIEYEDSFPYSDELEVISAGDSYSPSEINQILEAAEENGLTVIPLIQTFGHLEFVLKLDNFKEYREVEKYPEVLCPSHGNTTRLVRTMLDQVLRFHPRAKYVHLGCDEVHYLGRCDRCIAAKTKNNWTDHDLYLDHVGKMAESVSEIHPGTRPIIWGNKIAEMDEKVIRNHGIPDLTDVMIWGYTPEVDKSFGRHFFEVYSKSFKSIWIAGAFKGEWTFNLSEVLYRISFASYTCCWHPGSGLISLLSHLNPVKSYRKLINVVFQQVSIDKGATGPNRIVTDARYHLKNLVSWMRIVSEWKNRIDFKGIALTGWQRYDHFGILCELLPVSIPSLTVGLHYLRNVESTGINETSMNILLGCDGKIGFSPTEFKSEITGKCNFPGFPAYKSVSDFFSLKEKIRNSFPDSSGNGWVSAYNLIHRFSSPARVENFFEKFPVDRFKGKLKRSGIDLTESLSGVYGDDTVDEWLTTNMLPIRTKLEIFSGVEEILLERKIWPRRPLTKVQGVGDCVRGTDINCAFLLV